MPEEPETLDDRLNEKLKAYDPDLTVDNFIGDYRRSIQYDQILTFLSNIELKSHQGSMRLLTGALVGSALVTTAATIVNIVFQIKGGQ